VRPSCCPDSSSLPGSSTDPPDSAFTASAVLRRRLVHRRAQGKHTDLGHARKPSSAPSAWREIDPRHFLLSYRSLSFGNPVGLNSNGIAKIFHSFRQRLQSPQLDW